MHLEVIKYKEDRYLYKVNAVKVSKNKYKREKEFIGKESKLKLIYDDPILHFKTLIKEETKNVKENLIKTIKIKPNNFDILSLSNNLKVDENLEQNLGFIFLLHIYYQLGFENLLNSIKQKENTKIKLSKVLYHLILHNVLNIEDFELEKDDISKGIKILVKYSDKIVAYLNKGINKFYGYKFTNVNLQTYLLNKRVLVLTDDNNFPISYTVYSNDFTLIRYLEKQKRKFKIAEYIVVGDENDNILGLNRYILKKPLVRIDKDVMEIFENVAKPKLNAIMYEKKDLKGSYYAVENKKHIFYIFIASRPNVKSKHLEDAISYGNIEKVKTDIENITYSVLVSSGINKGVYDIITRYREQHQIKEYLKLSKFDIDANVEGRYLISFVSLAFLKLLQHSLENRFTIKEIQDKLKEFKLIKIRQNNLYQIGTMTEIIASLVEKFKLNISKDFYDLAEVEQLMASLKKH